MPRLTKPNPYCGFKDDRERRLALNTRARSYAIAAVATAVAGAPVNWTEKIRWLMSLFH
jgi:hypothetical protein